MLCKNIIPKDIDVYIKKLNTQVNCMFFRFIQESGFVQFQFTMLSKIESRPNFFVVVACFCVCAKIDIY